MLKFLRLFLDENPLSVCSDELSSVKRLLDEGDKLKLKQRASSVSLHILKGLYFLKIKAIVPELYPEEQVQSVFNLEAIF